MQAATERVLGDYGTVEEAYKPKAGKRYRRAEAPPRMGENTIKGSVPTQARRDKLARIEAQQARPLPKPRGGRARWAQLMGITRDGRYGIKVKVTGISAETYWLPYAEAENLYYEITGEALTEAVGEL